MKSKLILLLIVALVASSCRGRMSGLRRDQKNYDVVEEGSANGVAATLNAPGEPPPTPPSLTGTNADTTSAFTLPGGTMTTTDGQPGTIAGTLPQNQSGGIYGYPSDTPPRPRPRPAPVTPAPEPVPVPEQPQPTATATTATATATQTAAPPPAATETKEEKKQEEPAPAPPTSTDTEGTEHQRFGVRQLAAALD